MPTKDIKDEEVKKLTGIKKLARGWTLCELIYKIYV